MNFFKFFYVVSSFKDGMRKMRARSAPIVLWKKNMIRKIIRFLSSELNTSSYTLKSLHGNFKRASTPYLQPRESCATLFAESAMPFFPSFSAFPVFLTRGSVWGRRDDVLVQEARDSVDFAES